MKNRTYNQFCGLAYALDVVGERWTLLIIRDLLAGPRRFTDLMDGLPGISTSLLSTRLKELEQAGVVRRRVLPPPAGSAVYELTPLGQALEKSALELGRWGAQFMLASASREGIALPSSGAIALALKAFFRPEHAQGVDEIFELHLGDEVLQVQVKDGQLQVQQGTPWKADVIFFADMQCFVGLFAGQIKPGEALAAKLIQVEGDAAALDRFLRLASVPG